MCQEVQPLDDAYAQGGGGLHLAVGEEGQLAFFARVPSQVVPVCGLIKDLVKSCADILVFFCGTGRRDDKG